MPDEETPLVSGREVQNVINIFFADSVFIKGIHVCGYSYLPPDSPNRIFIDNLCVNNGNTLTHELGHFFSLLHTHGKSNTALTDELVNGSNCVTSGDEICDTPADPNLSDKVKYNFLTKTCSYTGTVKDAKGQTFKPMLDNIMSYSEPYCMDSLTPNQYFRIRNSLFYHERINLLCQPNESIPTGSMLMGAYPVPFTDELFVYYYIAEKSRVHLTVCDVTGREVFTLLNELVSEGFSRKYASFGSVALPAGVYILKMEVGGIMKQGLRIVKMNL